MPRLLMVGVSHHAAPLEIRECVAIDEPTWREHAPADVSTVFLSTCNRVEIYAWIEGRTHGASRGITRALARAADIEPAVLGGYLTVKTGPEALLHLIRVTSGLDSQVVGEEQVRGQVRDALRQAATSQDLPPALQGVVQRAIEAARHVRSATRLGKSPSIASAGVRVACRAIKPGLAGKLAVVLGAGVMARAAAEALLARGARVRVLNRTPEHAQRLMANLRGSIEVDSLERLPHALSQAVLVVGATASREPIVSAAAVASHGGTPLVLLDVALPRDVEPAVRDLPGVTLIDLDDLERLCPVDAQTRQSERRRAEELAVQEADRLIDWLRSRAAVPTIAELRTYAESVRMAELRRSASRLRGLTPEQVAAVEALTSGIVKKLMHGPTIALRDAARSPGGLQRSRSHILQVVRPSLGRRGVPDPHA